MTCNDLRFPELAPAARCCWVCSSWVPGIHKTEQWLALDAEQSIENTVYVAGVRQVQPVSLG
jgi:deaminated glutathione amidase